MLNPLLRCMQKGLSNHIDRYANGWNLLNLNCLRTCHEMRSRRECVFHFIICARTSMKQLCGIKTNEFVGMRMPCLMCCDDFMFISHQQWPLIAWLEFLCVYNSWVSLSFAFVWAPFYILVLCCGNVCDYARWHRTQRLADKEAVFINRDCGFVCE